MTVERMLELVLLNQVNDYIKNLDDNSYEYFLFSHDMEKMKKRSKELSDEFYSDYTIDIPSKEV